MYTVLGSTSTGNPLSVEFSSMSAMVSKNSAILRWTTESETSNAGFEIERKIKALLPVEGYDGKPEGEWQRIAFVGGAGTTNAKQEYLYVDRTVQTGTYLYRLKQIDTDGRSKYLPSIEVTVNGIPEEFVLYQNYPNPFNPVTVIGYSLPVTARVRIVVSNILGQELNILVDEQRTSGNYSVEFNAAQFPSGIYFYTLYSGTTTFRKKMLVTK